MDRSRTGDRGNLATCQPNVPASCALAFATYLGRTKAMTVMPSSDDCQLSWLHVCGGRRGLETMGIAVMVDKQNTQPEHSVHILPFTRTLSAD